MSDKTVIVAHVGSPFTPPEIPAAGGIVIFEPNPNGGPLWLGWATPEEAAELVAFSFYTIFSGQAPVLAVAQAPIPDETWTRPGIAEWALAYLGVTIEIKLKADMLADLQTAILGSESTPVPAEAAPAVAPAAEVAPDAVVPAPQPEAAPPVAE